MKNELTLDEAPFIAGISYFDPSIEGFPVKAPSGRVSFLYQGDDAVKARLAIQRIYANEAVNVLDFIKSLKSVRATIFRLKDGNGNGRREYQHT